MSIWRQFIPLTKVLWSSTEALVFFSLCEALGQSKVNNLDVGVGDRLVRQHNVLWLYTDDQTSCRKYLKHCFFFQTPTQTGILFIFSTSSSPLYLSYLCALVCVCVCERVTLTLRSKWAMCLLCMKPTPLRICLRNSMASSSDRFSFSAMKSNSSPPQILEEEKEKEETRGRTERKREQGRVEREE